MKLNEPHVDIKGENFELVKIYTYQGNITIKGKIDGIDYIEEYRKQTGKDLGTGDFVVQ